MTGKGISERGGREVAKPDPSGAEKRKKIENFKKTPA